MPGDPREAVIAAWRAESARLVGALTRMTRDLALAEDLAQDALVAALEQWPRDGVPDHPGAWLMTAARRRGVDHFRRADVLRRKVAELGHAAGGEEDAVPDLDDQVDHIEDDVLRLVFLTCHPALSAESRAALTLRLVGGLTTAEIARGFLATEAAMGQRISRAKRTLVDARAELELPTGAERTRRLDDVMAVVYLIFNEGYTATAGEDWMRPDLTAEATRLARLLADQAPDEPEVHGLQALLELQGSRTAARLDDAGDPVLLEAQDRTRWDRVAIRRGLDALQRAERLAVQGTPVGRYFLQAAIAAQHARAARPEDTDWRRIATLYDVLAAAAPGPVVEVNRAVAHGRAHGPEAGLAVLSGIGDGDLPGSPLVPGVRGDLLERAGRHGPAAAAFDEAATRTRNERERALLRRRAEENRHRAPRRAVRAVVLADDRVLLCRFRAPHPAVPPGVPGVWAAPGGGIEPGEQPVEALRRELVEEIGLVLAGDPPLVWHQEVPGLVNDYHLVRTPPFDPVPTVDLAAELVDELRWWTRAEIAAYAGPDLFSPRDLAGLLPALLAGDVVAPVSIGL